MPAGLRRYYGDDHLHFLTCSCYHRQPWLGGSAGRDLFLRIVEQARQRYRFVILNTTIQIRSSTIRSLLPLLQCVTQWSQVSVALKRG
jgi:hypothetical protein